MASVNDRPQLTIIGGGMITQVQILPTAYHLQREGIVGDIHIVALDGPPIKALQENKSLAKAFPGQSFTPHPDPAKVDPAEKFPNLFKEAFAAAPAGSIAIIAVPDQLHYPVIKEAIDRDLHVCIVKPLVLKHDQAAEIAELAREKGLCVGVEYHKRFDFRNLMARKAYRDGRFGQFRLAQAQMIEKWYYRDSNFMNWATCENTDMFTYVGCHYVDLIHFITGLKPVSVSVYGIVDEYPNGNKGYLWTDGRVIWENGACLSVVDALGYPNAGAGGNAQGLTMWCQGDKDGTLLVHSDQFRGVKHSYTEAGTDPGDTVYAEPNPEYFQMLDQGGDGLVPVGYGHRSVEYIVKACKQVAAAGDIEDRRKLLKRFDDEGIMATPANSSYNELVVEAARMSIVSGGREVEISYDPPGVSFRQY